MSTPVPCVQCGATTPCAPKCDAFLSAQPTSITINGKNFQVTGRNIVIRNGTVTVDGATITSGLSGDVHVKFEGELASLDADGAVTCGAVHGSVNAGGSVTCGDVGKSVSAGGSVRAAKVGGSMSAGGSIKVNP